MLRFSSIVGTALVGFGMLSLAFVTAHNASRTASFRAPAFNRASPISPASTGAILASGAMLLGKGRRFF